MKIIIGIILLLNIIIYANDDYIIDDYSFEWKIETVGEVNFSLIKENERTRVILFKKGGFTGVYLSFTPREAVLIGEKLKDTKKYYKKQKQSKVSISDKVNIGDYIINFSTSEKYGFSVQIIRDTLFTDPLYLTRKEARKLSNLLIQSKKMESFLNKKVDF